MRDPSTAPNSIPQGLREKFAAQQQELVAYFNAKGVPVVVRSPSDNTLAGIHGKRSMEAAVRAHVRRVFVD